MAWHTIDVQQILPLPSFPALLHPQTFTDLKSEHNLATLCSYGREGGGEEAPTCSELTGMPAFPHSVMYTLRPGDQPMRKVPSDSTH